MEPNNNQNDILGTIRSNAVEAQPPSSSNNNNAQRRIITMYRSGFTIDNGPFRRLDDPSNADFLRSLARGVTPRELVLEQLQSRQQQHGGGDTSEVGDLEVGLVDKRHMEYGDDDGDDGCDCDDDDDDGPAQSGTTAFSGTGQSLGDASSTADSNGSSAGIVTSSLTTAATTAGPPTLDESKPMTTIQIRLHNGKRLIVKCNLHDTVQTLIMHVEANGDDRGGRDYVLSSGYPPKVLSDFEKTVEECGLMNAQVVQKLV